MAVLSQDEARRERARKHAKRTWHCPICGLDCKGNGGKSSHKASHVRMAGLSHLGLREGWRQVREREVPKS